MGAHKDGEIQPDFLGCFYNSITKFLTQDVEM